MKRGRTDYRLKRRALLAEVSSGVRPIRDVQDAHPMLVRAGRHLGEPMDGPCPICDDEDTLRLVTYVFTGTGPTAKSGRAIDRGTLGTLLARAGEIPTYTVEVCVACHWHHLRESYWLIADSKVARARG